MREVVYNTDNAALSIQLSMNCARVLVCSRCILTPMPHVSYTVHLKAYLFSLDNACSLASCSSVFLFPCEISLFRKVPGFPSG